MINVNVRLRRGDFTLEVAFSSPGGVTGVFGPSGAGKTTLLHLIAGLERPDHGSIVVGGRTLFDGDRGIDLPAHRRRIGMVFQEHRLFPHYSVEGNLRYGATRTSRSPDAVVALLELEPLLHRRVHELSGGERQRVALGRALLSDPVLLLLDEPLASLDRRLRQQILPYLRRVRDELAVPILHVSHDITEILQLTERVLVLDAGQSIACGAWRDVVHGVPGLSTTTTGASGSSDQVGSAARTPFDAGAANVVALRVVEHRGDEGVSLLEFAGARRAGRAAATSTTDPARLRFVVAPACSAPVGAILRCAIRPAEIALATIEVVGAASGPRDSIDGTASIRGISIQNQFPGTVLRRTDLRDRTLVDVALDDGARDDGAQDDGEGRTGACDSASSLQVLTAEITRRSADMLDVHVGGRATCLFKSAAVELLGEERGSE